MPSVRPYGLWDSPVSADLIASASISFGDLIVNKQTGAILYTENRPSPAPARSVLVERGQADVKAPREVTPAPYSARTTVHEYGGGAIASCGSLTVFINHPDRRIYRVENQVPVAVTAESAVLRFADPCIHPNGKEILVVVEDHTIDTPLGVVNSLATVDAATGEITTFAQGYDFYSNPRYDDQGKRACYLRWNHPNMPWTGTELLIRDLISGTETVVAGSISGNLESVSYPKFGPDGKLYYASDGSGFWQLYAYDGTSSLPVVKANPMPQGEFAAPEWTFGGSSFDFLEGGIVASVVENAVSRLVWIDLGSGTLRPVDTPFTVIGKVRTIPSSNHAVFIAASPTSESCLYLFDCATSKAEMLARSSTVPLDTGYISAAKPVSFPTRGGQVSYGFYYPPTNKDFVGLENSKPPAIVKVHGGPTSNAAGALSLPIQYWTSRGFAFLDVNYGGSTGFGREYRRRLDGQWGIVDVVDAAYAAEYLAKGLADPDKIVITGGSAGGFTVLLALSLPLSYLDLRPRFATGTSSYGVADLIHLAEFTHKFELRYLDSLIGGTVGEIPDIYRDRSPVNNASGINVPICVFQGSEDKVVPPEQSEAIVKAVRDRGGRADYTVFEGEGHGWRQAANIKKALEGELGFYLDVLRIA